MPCQFLEGERIPHLLGTILAKLYIINLQLSVLAPFDRIFTHSTYVWHRHLYLHLPQTSTIQVGKNTSHMDAIGLI